ncbi:MAG: lipoprotein [Pseudomonadota bacterium]
MIRALLILALVAGCGIKGDPEPREGSEPDVTTVSDL